MLTQENPLGFLYVPGSGCVHGDDTKKRTGFVGVRCCVCEWQMSRSKAVRQRRIRHVILVVCLVASECQRELPVVKEVQRQRLCTDVTHSDSVRSVHIHRHVRHHLLHHLRSLLKPTTTAQQYHERERKSWCGSMAWWLAHLEFYLGDQGSNPGSYHYSSGQVVYSHCLPSFSAPRNWGTKGSFRHLSGYGD